MAELQQPDIVGNYLSRYNEAQQRQQAIADRQRTYQRQDRQDEMAQQQFEGQQDAQKLDMAIKRGSAMASIIGSVRDGDVQGFEAAKERAAQELGIDPKQMAHLTINDLPRLRTESGLALKQLQEQAVRANIRQSDAAAAASNRANRGGGAGGVLGPQFDDETKLRGEFIKGADEFVKVRDAFGRIQASASDPSAAGDLALIFSYMKILDPGSVVREQEFANAQNAAGVPDQIRNMYNKVLSGERLAPNQRQDFTGRATKLYQQQLSNFQKTRRIYEGLAGQYGFAPDRAAPDLSLGVTGDEGGPPPPPPSFTRGQGVFTDQPVQQAPAANGGWSIKRVQ